MASSEAGAAGHVVGIDLGTTNSVVAVSRKGRVEILANDCGSRITPSVVGFMQRQTYVGEAAADLPALNQVFDVKRLIGRPWREMKADEMSRWPFLVVEKAGIIRIRVAVDGTKEDFAPEELSALVLANLKQTAESALGGPVNRAVITVPAFFNERQRLATKVAGRIAELEVISIINEPTAAAIAYGLDNNSDTKKTVFIFDLGGGTFDVSVMTIKGSKFQVIATGGDTQLGGQDFDARLMDHLIKDIRAKHSVELDSQSVYDLRRACELAKRKLSALVQTSVSLHFARFNLGYQTTVTRALFEDLIADLLQKAMDAAALVLTESKVSVSAIDEVVLVGGSTRIPKVRSMLRDLFGGKELRHSINPDEAVAYGAAVQAAVLVGDGPSSGAEVDLKEDGARGPAASTSSSAHFRTPPQQQPQGRRTQISSAAAPAVGIDLGTTYSVVAVSRKGRVEVLANESGSRTTPSVVGFLEGQSYVGDAARDLPANSRVFDAKRMIGRPWQDVASLPDRKHWPFEVCDKRGATSIQVSTAGTRKEFFAPEEISGMVLRALKETAESVLGSTVTRAVITVPAYFNERQRQATMDAGKIAGLELLAMINEPTSAAFAYGLDTKATSEKTIFIFDLGGGTFDVSVMKINGSDFRVLASDGDTHLGGQDFDMKLMEHFMKDIRGRHGVNLDSQSAQDLRRECELAKRKLSAQPEAKINVFFSRCNLQYSSTISRATFEFLCADFFKQTMEITRRVLSEAHVSVSAIDEVVLVGGSTRIPKVRSMLRDLFGGKELRHSINPDEAVAYGAAVHAAVLAGDKFCENLVKLKDVTPLSLGTDIVGGRFAVIIPRNTPIPCKKTKRFQTVYDYQDAVKCEVYQGERPMVKDNCSLNKSVRVAVPPRPAGEADVDVTFKLDADGLLTVTCVEPTTEARQHVTISRSEAALREEDIEDMIQKAERFRRQDEEEKRRVELGLRLKRLHF